MNRDRLVRLGVVVFALACACAHAESGYDVGKRYWLQGEYRHAYETLLEYRKQPFGRRPEVDYMIGTSACRLSCCKIWGARFLDALPMSYALSRDSLALIDDEHQACLGTDVATRASVSPDLLERVIAAGVSGRAKVYWTPDQDVGLSTYPTRRIRDIPRAELVSRVVALGDAARAEAAAKSLAGIQSAKAFDRFVIASSSGHDAEAMKRIARLLDAFVDFLSRTYGVELPTSYVTVYLVPAPDAVEQLGERLHGLRVARGTIGYAFQDDLSIVAYVRGEGVGTVLHELTHLSVRSAFGDIPQWLDEGLAGLYEVSTVADDRTLGEPNWRGEVLQALWGDRPTVTQMIATQWFPFDVPEVDQNTADMSTNQAMQQVAFMAMARYFCLYLERQGVLDEVYRSVRDRDFGSGETIADATERALRAALGQDLEMIDGSFEQWFRSGVKTTSELGALPHPSSKSDSGAIRDSPFASTVAVTGH